MRSSAFARRAPTFAKASVGKMADRAERGARNWGTGHGFPGFARCAACACYASCACHACHACYASCARCSCSPQPNGFPSPPRVGYPRRVIRFAKRGPLGEGEVPSGAEMFEQKRPKFRIFHDNSAYSRTRVIAPNRVAAPNAFGALTALRCRTNPALQPFESAVAAPLPALSPPPKLWRAGRSNAEGRLQSAEWWSEEEGCLTDVTVLPGESFVGGTVQMPENETDKAWRREQPDEASGSFGRSKAPSTLRSAGALQSCSVADFGHCSSNALPRSQKNKGALLD